MCVLIVRKISLQNILQRYIAHQNVEAILCQDPEEINNSMMIESASIVDLIFRSDEAGQYIVQGDVRIKQDLNLMEYLADFAYIVKKIFLG